MMRDAFSRPVRMGMEGGVVNLLRTERSLLCRGRQHGNTTKVHSKVLRYCRFTAQPTTLQQQQLLPPVDGSVQLLRLAAAARQTSSRLGINMHVRFFKCVCRINHHSIWPQTPWPIKITITKNSYWDGPAVLPSAACQVLLKHKLVVLDWPIESRTPNDERASTNAVNQPTCRRHTGQPTTPPSCGPPRRCGGHSIPTGGGRLWRRRWPASSACSWRASSTRESSCDRSSSDYQKH